jgi:hypothetical protein
MDEFEDETPELEYATPADLAEVDLAEEDYDLGNGKKLRLRALTRLEMMRSSKLDNDRPKQEQYLLSIAVIKPTLTPADVAKWQRAKSFMEVERVARRINALSGVGKDAAKSGLPDDGESAGV